MSERTLHSTTRQRRRKLVTQLLALFGLGFSTVATAADRYYAPTHRGRAAVECCPPQSIYQPGYGATQPGIVSGGAMQGDSSQGATGPQGDDFLSDDAGTGATSPSPNFMSDVDAVVNGAGAATPLAFSSGRGGGLDAPNMIGDFYDGYFEAYYESGGLYFQNGSGFSGAIAVAGAGRRFKITENVSPIPQDRILFNYNHYHNAQRDAAANDGSMDLFTFGAERTFLDGLGSIEARLPFASTLDSTQVVGQEGFGTELGSLQFALKVVLLSGRNWLVSAGTTMSLPTGDDFTLYDAPGGDAITVENETVHLGPFLGYVVQPNRDTFFQAFVQTDFATGGNTVRSTANGYEGEFQEQHLLFLSASAGRWMYRANSNRDALQGIAGIFELHYTTTMNDSDEVDTPITTVGNVANRLDILNATAAMDFAIGKSSLRIGGGAPLRFQDDKSFDAEFLIQFNRFF